MRRTGGGCGLTYVLSWPNLPHILPMQCEQSHEGQWACFAVYKCVCVGVHGGRGGNYKFHFHTALYTHIHVQK